MSNLPFHLNQQDTKDRSLQNQTSRENQDIFNKSLSLSKQESGDLNSIKLPQSNLNQARQQQSIKFNKPFQQNDYQQKKDNQDKGTTIQSSNDIRNIYQMTSKGISTFGKGSKQRIQSSQQIKQTYDFTNHNVEIQENGKLMFKDIREDILTKKVEKALFQVQQIDNQKHALTLLGLKHFFINLARFTHAYMNKNLTKTQKIIIKDISLPENNISTFINNSQRNQGNREEDDQKLGIIERIISSIPLFYPSNTFLVLWDIVQLVFILFFFYAIPLQIVFNLGLGRFISDLVFNTGIILFVIDNVLCINTTYFEKGIPVKDRQLIWQHYLKKHFVTDFLSNIPVLIDYFILNLKGGWGLIMLIQYLKVDRITIIIRKVQERFHLTPQQLQLISLAKLLFRVLFVAHIFACIWLQLALSNNDDKDVWLDKFEYTKKSWSEQYLVSYYFATVTMITVGYGDFAPLNNREFIFCIFTMLIACGVFAYAVNQIGSIFENIGRQEQEMNEMMYSISSYMHLKKVSKELQYQIREYLQYYWRESLDRDTDMEEKIKSQLSDNLKDQLALEANNIVLKDSIVFKNNFSNQVISKTVPLIKEYRATPEETILIENTITEDQNIYFIEKGQVEVFLGQSDQPIQIKKLSSGDCFGQVGFFTGLSRTLSVRSLDFTTLVYVKRSEFIELLKEYPEDYEQFCFIRDKILIESDYRLIGMKCYSCRDGKHLSQNCPYLHYTPKKFFLLKKYFYPGYQNRDEQHKRKKVKKSINCLKGEKEIQEKAEEIQEQFSMIIDDLFGDDDFYSNDEKQEENEGEDKSDEGNSVELPSYLCQDALALQKGASIEKQVENSNFKVDESFQNSEDSNPAGSNKKIHLPHNTTQNMQIFDQKSEEIFQFFQQDKHINAGAQVPRQISMNVITENRLQELSNNTDFDIQEQIQKFANLLQQKDGKEGRKKKGSIPQAQHRYSIQKITSSGAIKDILNNQLNHSQSNQNIQLPMNLQQYQQQNSNSHNHGKTIRQVSRQESRQESRRKSTKKQLVQANGLQSSLNLVSQQIIQQMQGKIREETNVSRQLSTQSSRIDPFHRSASKQKLNKMTSNLGKNLENKLNNPQNIENLKRSSYEANQVLLISKLTELLANNQGAIRRGTLDNNAAQNVIEGSDNQNNLYGLEDFETLKNYIFYYPASNYEIIVEKFQRYQNNKSRRNFNRKFTQKIQGNGATPQQPASDFLRKQRKTGGTRIIAAGGVTGNLLNKFRQQEEQSQSEGNQDIDSQGGFSPNQLAANGDLPFSRAGARKTTKRQNIVSPFRMSVCQDGQESPKDGELDLNKGNQTKKSLFQMEQSNQIDEDESELINEKKNSNAGDMFDKSIIKKTDRDNCITQQQDEYSKFSSRNNILEEGSQLRVLDQDENTEFKGNTFSKIPSFQSINDNGHLPSFKNFYHNPKKNIISKHLAL